MPTMAPGEAQAVGGGSIPESRLSPTRVEPIGNQPTAIEDDAPTFTDAEKNPPARAASPKAASSTQGASPKDMGHLIGQTIDGFRIEKLLGAGGMGAVFLAHQISLDRKVAMKVLPSRFARHAELLARFTREALSAAQLSHHNIVQVYDVGSTEDVHYITMEYVPGQSLADMIRSDGRLGIDAAAGYVLQTARGLKYAHDRGIIHRDIKPANLMVSELGIVKIADMGLAKMAKVEDVTKLGDVSEREKQLREQKNIDLTSPDIAMGTPAYMAPEQATDASSVDPRADQYSLGCTLYYLCAGKAPYSGSTAFELMSKHKTEALTPLDVHIANVPSGFRSTVERMLAKKPEDRFETMEGVIHDLEAYLGVESEKGPYTPREKHLAILESERDRFYAAPSIKKRRAATLGFAVAMPLLFAFALFTKSFVLAGGLLGLFVLTLVANFTFDGVKNKTFIFRRVRAVFFGMPVKSWAMTVGGVLLALGALYVIGWLLSWIGFAFVSAGLAAAYQWFIARPLLAERAESIGNLQDMLKELRVRGVAEEGLQDFVCRFGGIEWEEMFESLFGYEAMILARGKWAKADKAKPRKKHATWREPIVQWLEGVEEDRQVAKDKKQMAKVEAKRLEAEGVSEEEAQRQAAEAATVIIDSEYRKMREADELAAQRDAQTAGEPMPVIVSGARPRMFGKIFTLGRAAVGAVILGAAVLPLIGMDAPPPLNILLNPDRYYAWGFGGTIYAALAGAVILLSTLSRRTGLSLLAVIGALLLVGGFPIVEFADQPNLTETTLKYGSMLMVALGIGPAILSKLTGGRF